MPLPTPTGSEDRRAFISRCMGDEVMVEEFPDEEQRAAVCNTQWRNRNKDEDVSDMELKREAFEADIELKQDGEEGVFTGFASTFGNMDHHRDVIERGAFAKTIKKRGPRGIKLLAFHNPDEPIGVLNRIEEKPRGLEVEGQLALGVQRAAEVHQLMQMRALDAMSIGFQTKEFEINEDRRVRTLKEIDLFEVSIVTFPANERARIRTVKECLASGELPEVKTVERVLRDAGFSIKQAKAFIADGYAGLRGLLPRDAEQEAIAETAKALREMFERVGINT